MDELKDRLLALRHRRGLTIDELVEQAERLLPQVAQHQTRYKVSERPDARTIRYYVTRGFLPKAEGYEGGRARYGGAHLLRLLLVKKLQAEQHTLARIGTTLKDADERRVLSLLLEEDPGEIDTAPAATAPPQALRRVSLALGANLDLPEALLASAEARETLAISLESVARWLRDQEQPESQQGEAP